MPKKIISILLLLACLTSLTGCKNSFYIGAGTDNDTSFLPTTPNSRTESSESVTSPTETDLLPTAPAPAQQPTEATPPQTDSPLPKPSLEDSDFVAIKDYIPEIVVDLKYATEDNFTGQVIYEFHDAYLRYGTVKKLIEVSKTLAEQGLYLKIWDAFRPSAAQFKLWEIYPDPNYVSNPNVKYSSHSRGNTVDITLVDAHGMELEMPTGFDDFSALADRDYSDCNPIAAANALLLQQIMEDNGFSGYSKEWWHYSDETEYSVEECFDPAVIST